MRVMLLPGLDGTGRLFSDLVACAPHHHEITVISYPPDQALSYSDHVAEFLQHLPAGHAPFLAVAESFSGPISVLMAH